MKKLSPIQFIAALGDKDASNGKGAQEWGLWRLDPGPRGGQLGAYEKLAAQKARLDQARLDQVRIVGCLPLPGSSWACGRCSEALGSAERARGRRHAEGPARRHPEALGPQARAAEGLEARRRRPGRERADARRPHGARGRLGRPACRRAAGSRFEEARIRRRRI